MNLPQSTASRRVFKVVLTSDHVTPATGKTVAVTISKNGGAFGNPSAGATNATEIGAGWYYVDLSTTDTATLGPIIVKGTSATCDDAGTADDVTLAPGSVGGPVRLGANIGNTTFTGSGLGNPGLSVDGLQTTNANWGAYPLYFSDTLGTGAVGLSAVGSAAVLTFLAAGGHIFSATPGANKDVFHATLSGTGKMFNPIDDLVTDIGNELAGQTIIALSPVGKGSLEIVSGDAYLTAENRQLDFTKPTGANWPTDLTGMTITLNAKATPDNTNTTGNTSALTKTGTIINATGASQKVRFQLTASETNDLAVGQGNTGWKFSVVAHTSSGNRTLVTGTMTVLEDIIVP